MLKALLGGYARFRVFVQHQSNQVLCFVADVSPMLRIKFKFLFENISEYLCAIITLERRIAAQEDVEDDAERPHITRLIIILFQNFWCYVIWCADNSLHLNLIFVFIVNAKALRESKVNQLYLRIRRTVLQQKVFWLEVAVADFQLMQMLYSRDDLPHVIGCACLAEALALDDFVEELAARGQLHDDVDVAEINIRLVKLYYVGMVEATQDFELLLERLHVLLYV